MAEELARAIIDASVALQRKEEQELTIVPLYKHTKKYQSFRGERLVRNNVSITFKFKDKILQSFAEVLSHTSKSGFQRVTMGQDEISGVPVFLDDKTTEGTNTTTRETYEHEIVAWFKKVY